MILLYRLGNTKESAGDIIHELFFELENIKSEYLTQVLLDDVFEYSMEEDETLVVISGSNSRPTTGSRSTTTYLATSSTKNKRKNLAWM